MLAVSASRQCSAAAVLPTLVASQSIQSRDLIFAKDTAAAKGSQATYVVNKSELAKAVTAKFTINHKP